MRLGVRIVFMAIPRALLLMSLLLGSCQLGKQGDPPPNVVMIISDDQAWGDFGFMGHPMIKTPHLDRLAARSVVFPRGYVPSSLCRPSLATMITGLYPHQHKITGNDPPKGVKRDRMLKHMEAVPTLPKMLASLGYRSLQTGKWWEGNCRCGGFTDGMTHGELARGGRHGDDGLRIGRETMQPVYDFISAKSSSPFFLWYAPFLPHMPHNPPKRLLDRYLDSSSSKQIARYYAMCEWFDETCGQLLQCLDEQGVADNTIVLFVVDNGWVQRPDRRGYAKRSKRSPYEGGVRTPIMISWPGHWTPARRDEVVSSIDLAPTILHACGASVPDELPGRNLQAISDGDSSAVFGEIFAHDVADIDDPSKSLLYRWVVMGRYKLIVPAKVGSEPELYDLLEDPAEKHDLAAKYPSRMSSLRALIDRWWDGQS
jgi:arylsulfatase A-like enzyme